MALTRPRFGRRFSNVSRCFETLIDGIFLITNRIMRGPQANLDLKEDDVGSDSIPPDLDLAIQTKMC